MDKAPETLLSMALLVRSWLGSITCFPRKTAHGRGDICLIKVVPTEGHADHRDTACTNTRALNRHHDSAGFPRYDRCPQKDNKKVLRGRQPMEAPVARVGAGIQSRQAGPVSPGRSATTVTTSCAEATRRFRSAVLACNSGDSSRLR